jgi:hypothetical protein
MTIGDISLALLEGVALVLATSFAIWLGLRRRR